LKNVFQYSYIRVTFVIFSLGWTKMCLTVLLSEYRLSNCVWWQLYWMWLPAVNWLVCSEVQNLKKACSECKGPLLWQWSQYHAVGGIAFHYISIFLRIAEMVLGFRPLN
jgi:hypothetical protein